VATTDSRSVDQIINEMTRRIVERFDPLQVILFGSHARGEAHADSDVDLLVVFPTSKTLGSWLSPSSTS
jgi:predicted nucleotidyltransferase